MNIAVLGERNLQRFGEYPAVVFGDEERTNAEQLDRARRLAGSLAELGVAPGDRVGVMMPNSMEIAVAYGAISRAGGVIVPILFLLAVPEVAHILSDAGARAIFTSSEFAPAVRAALEGLDDPPVVILIGDEPSGPGEVSYDDLVAGGDPAGIVDRDGDDLAVISYTSGTTGRPKGVMLSHANLMFNAENTAQVAPTRNGDVSLAALPLAHLFGLGSGLVVQLFKIRSVILDWFTVQGVFDAVQGHRITSTAFVPAMVQLLLADPGFDDVDWSSLEYAVVGAAPVPAEMAAEFERRTAARVLEGYGLTETSPTVALQRLDDPSKPGSCGRPVPNVDVAILNDDGSPVPAGEHGEVCVRGPNVMLGYRGMSDETAAAIRDGWFHTGDVGALDEDGFLFITDRKKDLIIRGGFNIVPRDVEEVLHAHPAVQEAAAVGVPDPTLGEEVAAFVVLRPGAEATQEELLALCRDRLARYKTPRFVWFVDALPRNAVGKVLKTELRASAAERVSA
jgi:long-chain acyl-CoA synthetase